ncbi:MAG TPA: hypothetical protein VG944_16420 [Fimbriimonas sp.]|nr:hypothetical protein [Fimbriimonas sp.]
MRRRPPWEAIEAIKAKMHREPLDERTWKEGSRLSDRPSRLRQGRLRVRWLIDRPTQDYLACRAVDLLAMEDEAPPSS